MHVHTVDTLWEGIIVKTAEITLDELEQIATRPQPYKEQWTSDFDTMKRALPELLKIARAVAAREPLEYREQGYGNSGYTACVLCGSAPGLSPTPHKEDCVWVMARKLAGGAP